MKKELFTLLALLMTVMGANAQEPTTYFVELTTDRKPEGASFTMTYTEGSNPAQDVSTYLVDEVAPVPAGAKVTLTVTPAQGYVAGTVTGETFMEGSEMRTRGNDPVISILGDVEITQSTTNPNVFTYTQPTANVRLTVSYLKMVTVTADNQIKQAGEKDPTLTATVSGTIGEDKVIYTLSRAEGEEVGEYTITPAGDAVQGKYAVTFVNGKLTINPKVVTSPTITLSPTSFTYDGEAKKPTVTVTDGGSTIPTSEYTVSYSNNINAGTATVTITDLEGGRYTVSGTTTFTIARKDVTVTADDQTKQAGEKDPTLTATVSGTIGEDQVTYTLSRVEGEEVGEYAITPAGNAEQGNYAVTFVKGKLTITEADTPDNPEPVVEETPTEDGGTITTTTTTEKLEDGTEKETKVEEKKDADGNVESVSETIKETKTEDDGSSVESTQTTKTDGEGNFVSSETIEEKKDADGNVEKTTTQAEVPEVSGDAIAVKDEATGKEENYYPASKETQEKLDNIVSADVAFEESSVQNIQVVETTKEKVTKAGEKSKLKSYKLNCPKYEKDSKMSLLGQKKGPVLKSAVGKGKLLAFKKDLVKVTKTNTRGEGDADDNNMIELESGEDYKILQDGDLVLTLKTSESDVEINSIAISEATDEPDDPVNDEPETITIGKSGKASYCGDQSLDFGYSDEVKAYIATGFDKDEGTIWLTRVKDVPAGVPVLIKGDANKTYDVPVTDSQNSYYTNMFVGNTSGEKMVIQETDGDMMNYYLSGDGTFKSVNKTANIGTNKCYLQLPGTFEAAATGATQTVKVGSIGKASFAAPVDLDFTNVSGLKAFTATGYDKSTKTIWLTRVMKVQKGEGVLLKGDPNNYEIPSVAVQSSYENMFVGNTSGDEIRVQETSEDGSQTNYYLSGKDGSFVSVNGFAKIGNNKCYLALPTSMVAVSSTRSLEDELILEEAEMIKLPIEFKSIGSEGDGTTSIREVKSGEVKGEEWYTLQGQRVAKPGKGLYIRNGKMVIVR